jgi:hypothetical protein
MPYEWHGACFSPFPKGAETMRTTLATLMFPALGIVLYTLLLNVPAYAALRSLAEVLAGR